MTHLEVTPEGIFVIENCPEEPKYTDYVQHDKYYWQVKTFERAKKKYESALASCKRIRVSDQDYAKRLIWVDRTGLPFAEPITIKPGIYSLPDVEWEETDEWTQDATESDEHFRERVLANERVSKRKMQKVAILKESPKESQEELWKEVRRILGMREDFYYGERRDIETLLKQFKITRNK